MHLFLSSLTAYLTLGDIPPSPDVILTQPQPLSIVWAAIFVSIWIAGFGLLAARRKGHFIPAAVGLGLSVVVIGTAILIAYVLNR